METDDPEAGLREMLEARERELEERRVRTSGIFTKILLAGVSVAVLAVWAFPERKLPPAAVKAPDVPAETVDPALKPFLHLTGGDSHGEDARFAGELLDFIRPHGGGN